MILDLSLIRCIVSLSLAHYISLVSMLYFKFSRTNY